MHEIDFDPNSPHSPSRMFRYSWSTTAAVDLATAAGVTLFTWIGVSTMITGPDYYEGLEVMCIFDFILIPCFVLNRLRFSSILVTQTHVAAYVFGIRLKMIRWSEVRKILRIREQDESYNIARDIISRAAQPGRLYRV